MDRKISPLIRTTLTLVLAGGQGERLFPLTKDRSKPSVPFAGSFRIIDFTLSNCINSDLRHIFVLTQYKSQSLNRHIRDGWNLLSQELHEFIETVPPQKRTHSQWYEGTCDAIYQNVFLLEQFKPKYTLILSGDHIYGMDYRELLAFHVQNGANVSIACFEFPTAQAKSFGVMHVDANDRVVDFIEKPSNPPSIPEKPGRSLINMGIYIFDTSCLVRAVIDDHKNAASQHDFGKDVLPLLVRDKSVRVFAYPFNRQSFSLYWRDVGSISSYFNASMDLLRGDRPFDLYSKDWPFRSALLQLPPCRINQTGLHNGQIQRSLVSGGCFIDGSLNRCLISPGVSVEKESELEECIVFNDTKIGANCKIRNTIVDKNVVIPDGCRIGFEPEIDRRQFMLSNDAIVVIPKNMIVEKHL